MTNYDDLLQDWSDWDDDGSDDVQFMEFDFSENEELHDNVFRQDEWDRAVGKRLNEEHSLHENDQVVTDFHNAVFQISPEKLGCR